VSGHYVSHGPREHSDTGAFQQQFLDQREEAVSMQLAVKLVARIEDADFEHS
jgi:hypothetical protein